MYGKWKVLLVAIILSTLVLGCTAPAEKTVKAGDTVYIDYVCRLPSGKVVDTTNETVARESGIYNPALPYVPYSFLVGAHTAAVQGFEEVVPGMRLNETKTNVTIPPEKAYGEYNASKVLTAPLEILVGNATNFSVFVGETIMYNDEPIYVAVVGANNTTAKVVYLGNLSESLPYSVTVNANETATLDYNHPLAGKTLICDITVTGIGLPTATPK
jgi:peptidylprolyl isomerase